MAVLLTPTTVQIPARERAPRATLGTLTGTVAEFARTALPAVLAWADEGTPDYGGRSGPTWPLDIVHDSARVYVAVYTDASQRSNEAWHTYWRQTLTERGAYDCTNATAAAGAPPRPSRDVAFVAVATWEELRAWLTAPVQMSLGDLLGAAA
jgi:hypothetical protein